jgi:hypothetical protein
MSHAVELLEAAILSLARSGAIKDRLTTAYRDFLLGVDTTELPREARSDFDELRRSMERERPMSRGDDAVRATVRKMSNAEAERLAALVVRMFGACGRSTAPTALVLPFAQPSATSPVEPSSLVDFLAVAER